MSAKARTPPPPEPQRQRMIMMGAKVRDVISGFEGRVTGRAEYITGCTQLSVVPTVDADGKSRDCQWFDEDRLEVVGEPVGLPRKTRDGGPQPNAPRAR